MKTLIEKKYINIGFVIGLLILLTINIFTYINTSNHLDEEKLTESSQKIIRYSDMLVFRLADAESNRRGFLLTGSEEFIKSYNGSISQIDTIFSSIKILTSGTSSLKPAIDSLALLLSNRSSLLTESVELGESKSKTSEELINLTDRGVKTRERIKYLVSGIQKEEREFINRMNEENSRNSRYILIQIIIGTAIGFIVLISGLIILNKNLKRRVESEKALEENSNWFSTTLKSIGEGVIVTNHIGDITFMNPVAQALTGWNEIEAKGIYFEHVFNIINEETHEKINNPVSEVFKNGKIISHTEKILLVKKEGKAIPVDVSASPIAGNGNSLLGVVLAFRDVSERRKAELEILQNQKFIQRISESIPNILYVYEVSGPNMIYVNTKIQEILGYKPEDVINMGEDFFRKYVHPEDYENLIKRNWKFNTSSDLEVIESEYRIRNTAGEWRWLRSYDVVFRNGSGDAPVQILGTALDVTEKKQLEDQIKKYSQHLEEVVGRRTSELRLTNEKLQQEITERIRAEKNISEAEEKFRSLVEYSLVGIYIIQNGVFVYVNPKLEEILGYEPNELIGVDCLDVVESSYVSLVSENIRMRLENELSDIQYSFKAIKKNGRLIDVEARGTKMMYEGKTAVIGTLQDITEQKEAQEALKEQEELLRAVIDSAPNMIYVKDWEGKFILINQAGSDYYSMEQSQILGKTDAEIGREKESDKTIEEDRHVMSRFEPLIIPEEKFEDSKSTNSKWMQIIKVPLNYKDNKRQVLCILTDITARKIAEENIRTSLKQKELLLQEIHHRVKNNLQIIVSLLKLQSRYIYDKRDLEIFSKSRARVETMSLIHEKLYKSSDLANISMRGYLTDLTSQLLKAYGVDSSQVIIHVDSAEVNVGIDTAIPCGLIVNELVSNSLKHAFRINQVGIITINVKKEDNNIMLYINDNGVGLPGDFDIETTESLGLQLVTTLVKQLGGTLNLDSSKTGTAIVIIFPELKYKARV